MAQTTSPGDSSGATAVITHRVRSDKHAEYERWLDEIVPVGKASPGHLDLHIIRPIAGITETFTIILRFDTEEHLQNWMNSAERERLIARAQPLLSEGDDFYISSGLDFWFAPTGARAKIPLRWKQFLLTWSAIFPLALLLPYIVTPALSLLGVSSNQLVNTFVTTAVIVFFMVYIIMPRYTRLLKRWLFR
tara:strand:+ start:1930 stop:2502 length:573 start_codon:yes stop_codon:yes gene_type:complete